MSFGTWIRLLPLLLIGLCGWLKAIWVVSRSLRRDVARFGSSTSGGATAEFKYARLELHFTSGGWPSISWSLRESIRENSGGLVEFGTDSSLTLGPTRTLFTSLPVGGADE